ncbi:MAG TPA: hypothetical protein PKE21_13600 [Flavobacteriales bacterium]|nr:hypothetical protein [Flavobacteriales bacterium]HMR28511.1 hypothetical protein [Flavobacteriales bacterium]
MKRRGPLAFDQRRKLQVLLLVMGLVVALLVHRKVLPTMHRWAELRNTAAGERSEEDLAAELRSLRTSLDRMEQVFGPGQHGQDRWAMVLTRTAQLLQQRQGSLHEVHSEHQEEVEGRMIHTLPLVLTGRADVLLTCADALERELPGVRLVSIDLCAEQRPPARDRALYATLTFRTIQP